MKKKCSDSMLYRHYARFEQKLNGFMPVNSWGALNCEAGICGFLLFSKMFEKAGWRRPSQQKDLTRNQRHKHYIWMKDYKCPASACVLCVKWISKHIYFVKSHLGTIIARSCLLGFNFLWFYELTVTTVVFTICTRCELFFLFAIILKTAKTVIPNKWPGVS